MARMCQSSTCGASRSAFFAQLAAYDDGAGMGVTGGDRPLQVQAMHVSADYFLDVRRSDDFRTPVHGCGG